MPSLDFNTLSQILQENVFIVLPFIPTNLVDCLFCLEVSFPGLVLALLPLKNSVSVDLSDFFLSNVQVHFHLQDPQKYFHQ